jgi:hypothetical protein
MLCAPEWIRRAALGDLPPLRGFAPRIPQGFYSLLTRRIEQAR